MHNRGAKYVAVGKNTLKLDEQDHLVEEILKQDIHANTIIYHILVICRSEKSTAGTQNKSPRNLTTI